MKFRGPKKTDSSQSVSSKAQDSGLDRVYALLRRINGRLVDVESKLSIVRRDINRIEKKVYRDQEQSIAPANHDEQQSDQALQEIGFLGGPGWPQKPQL